MPAKTWRNRMEKADMDSSAGKLGGDMEEGGSLRDEHEAGDEVPDWRPRKSRQASRVVLLATCVLLLLWKYGYPTRARTHPTIQRREVDGVPQYILDYAPLVYLDVREAYFPSDIAAQVENTTPYIKLNKLDDPPSPLSLANLDTLNAFGHNGSSVYLTTTIDITESPAPIWLNGVVPDSATGKTHNAISCAIIFNERDSETVDAFYMYFYAYNQGNTVFWKELGDHIGDWEHNMIRFVNGEPEAVWYSQHGNGQAFTYAATEKKGLRPFSYSARGSHANYAIPGDHDHSIPNRNLPRGFLIDYTSRGILWDPIQSSYFYNYHATNHSFESINDSPVGAMTFRGKWGDHRYPDSDSRQPPPFFGFSKFVGGPTGPRDKQLNRTEICPETWVECIVRDKLGP